MQVKSYIFVFFGSYAIPNLVIPGGHFYQFMLLLVLLKKRILGICNAVELLVTFSILLYEFLALVYLHDDGVFISQNKYIGQNVNHKNLENASP